MQANLLETRNFPCVILTIEIFETVGGITKLKSIQSTDQFDNSWLTN